MLHTPFLFHEFSLLIKEDLGILGSELAWGYLTGGQHQAGACACRCPQSPGALDPRGAEVAGGLELPDVGAGNHTQAVSYYTVGVYTCTHVEVKGQLCGSSGSGGRHVT